MLFNSPTFAVFFLTVLAGYWLLPGHRARLTWLLTGSIVFYAAWYPIYLFLLVGVTGVNYVGARAVHHFRNWPARVRKLLLASVVAVDLVDLGVFKYYDFFVDSTVSLSHALGLSLSLPAFSLFLPLGISFYTFQLIAYVVDVHRGTCGVIRNPLKMMLFIAFFPQLIAGPIVRANEFVGQLSSKREFVPARFLHGVDLVAIGLFKKVLVADQLAPFVDQVFAAPEGLSAGTLLLAVYAYSIQIYCDFSGYTDIGRGCAYCLGYELPRNFLSPYLSLNIVEFWRRWHMTLSHWLRDYLYIPLGGNRHGRERTYLNLLITMTLGGLWHGASWTFVVWGALHGLGLAFVRVIHEWRSVPPDRPLVSGRAYRLLSIVFTFHFVSLLWVFFRAPTFEVARTVLVGLFGFRLLSSYDIGVFGFITLALVSVTVMAAGLLHLASTAATRARLHRGVGWALLRPVLYALVTVGLTLLAGRGAQQFIYFQF